MPTAHRNAENQHSELGQAAWSPLPLFKRSLWFSLAITLFSLGPIVYMQEVYGRVVNSRNVETLIMLSVLLLATIALQEFLEWIRTEVRWWRPTTPAPARQCRA